VNPVRHHRLRGALDAYADGELPATASDGFAAHLDECPTCRFDAELTRWIKRALRRADDRTPRQLGLRRFATDLAGHRSGRPRP
jgi:anti-sigma factor RsiW